MAQEMTDISLPWHPESEKPMLPCVICYNGGELYWIGRYDNYMKIWLECGDWNEWQVMDGMCWIAENANIPFAWCDPSEFVPFEKKKPATHALYLKCNQCGFTDFVLREDAKEWECPSCLMKKKNLHICQGPDYQKCCEDDINRLFWSYNDVDDISLVIQVAHCPFCGYKAGDK